MPYKFNDYQSTYVDPQSVAISKELRGRFMTNFQNADALDESLDAMKAANFENDERMKAELDNEIGNKLNTLADKGDFENQGFRIHGAAKEYKEKYAPLYDNYQRYANYQTDLAERYKKGEISSLAYNYAIPYTKYAQGYQGIKVDPKTGLVDPNSYYSPMNIVSDPKIDEKLAKALEMIEADSTSSSSTTGKITPGEMMKVTKGGSSSWEGITEEKVAKAYNAVMADPEVQAYLEQQSKLKAYAAVAGGDGQIDEGRLNQINSSGIQAHQTEIAKLEDLISSNKVPEAKKAGYRATLESYRASLKNLETQTGDGRLNYAASLAKQELLAPYASMAETKIYSKTATTSTYDEDYDKLWLQKQSQEAEKQREIEKANELAKALVNKTPGNVFSLTGFTATELDGKITEIDSQLYGLTAQLETAGAIEQDEIQTKINALTLNKISLQEAASANKDESYVRMIDKLTEKNSDFGDIDNWGAGTIGIDFKEIWSEYQNWKGDDGQNQKDFTLMMEQGDWEGTDLNAFRRHLESVYPKENPYRALEEVRQEVRKTLNSKEFAEYAKPMTIQTTESNMPFGTEPAIAAATKKNMDDTFKGKPLSSLNGFTGIYRPGKSNDKLKDTKSGDLSQMMEDWGTENFNLGGAKIVDITYNSLDGMTLAKESKTGQFATFTVQSDKDPTQVRQIHVPVEQVYSQDMLNAMNEPINQINNVVRNVQRVGGGDAFDLVFEKGLTANENRAEQLVKAAAEHKKDHPGEFQNFLTENAAELQKLQISGNLHIQKDNIKFVGAPTQTMMKFSGLKSNDVQVELYKMDPATGEYVPETTFTNVPLGKFSATSSYFQAIVNDQNMRYFQLHGYNPKIN
jgi:hypothetical protein